MRRACGALPFQDLRTLIEQGVIAGSSPVHTQPASLDLTASTEMYRTTGIFLPRPGQSVRDMLKRVTARRHDPFAIMERDITYLVRLNESFALPRGIYGYANPKSSSGRVNVHVRVLADGISRYDTLPRGYAGETWLSVLPGSFPVILPPGESLAQMRLFDADTRLGERQLARALEKEGLLFRDRGTGLSISDLHVMDGDGTLTLTLDFCPGQAGWRSFGIDEPIDLGLRDHYDPAAFFKPIIVESAEDMVTLRRGGFYILQGRERVRVPPGMACEMRPMDERLGDIRSHQAGYIDPGWGWGKAGEGRGRPLTLEVVPFESCLVYDGRPIAKIRFEQMRAVPDRLYDTGESNHYQGQFVPLLSKHFKQDRQIKAAAA